MCNTCGCKDAESFGAETFELIMIDSLGKRETFGEYETYEDALVDVTILDDLFSRTCIILIKYFTCLNNLIHK